MAKIKTEMHGTGGGRWTTRADAKQISKKARRENDKQEASDMTDQEVIRYSPQMPEDDRRLFFGVEGLLQKHAQTQCTKCYGEGWTMQVEGPEVCSPCDGFGADPELVSAVFRFIKGVLLDYPRHPTITTLTPEKNKT